MNRKIVRKRKLSTGWYPDNPRIIKTFIEDIIKSSSDRSGNEIAAIIPHAGWDYSGSLVIKSINQLYKNPDTVVVIGGHLPPDSPLYYSFEDIYETPLGDFILDRPFMNELLKKINFLKDFSSDNTVEVIIPIVKYFYPKAKLISLRVGSGLEAVQLGNLIYKISMELNRKIVVLGSTDLTHYGPGFSFVPHGIGEKAVDWVKTINDKDIIDKMLIMDYQGVLDLANNNFSACSSGSAASTICFASLSNILSGHLIGYSNSYDISPSESFVGYVGITY